jgi:hypothetical protein
MTTALMLLGVYVNAGKNLKSALTSWCRIEDSHSSHGMMDGQLYW